MKPAFALLCLMSACSAAPAAPDAALPPRLVERSVVVDATGLSDEITVDVPSGTRAVTIVIEGDASGLYALGELRTSDGIDRIALPDGAPGPAMRSSYEVEQVGQMPGMLFQSIRLGTFTQIYPYRPDQAVPVGALRLRVASDTAGPAKVNVLMPEDDGARTLHVNLIVVSDTLTVPQPPPFLDEARAIFAQAQIDLVVDQIVPITGSALRQITTSTEPQESPSSMAAMLPGLTQGQLTGPALDLFVVDSLPAGVAGLSLGTPGPPLRGSYYYGVLLIEQPADADTARVLAHEVCHYLALQHVTNRGASGTIYPDPLDDTAPGQGNLMEHGATLTADQAFALQRSALLQSL